MDIPFESYRNEWIDAYHLANIEQLDYIESSAFVVIADGKVAKKEEQLHRIRQLHKGGRWIDPSTRRVDKNLNYVDFDQKRLVYGVSESTTQGRQVQTVAFSELWVQKGKKWEVVFLMYETLSI